MNPSSQRQTGGQPYPQTAARTGIIYHGASSGPTANSTAATSRTSGPIANSTPATSRTVATHPPRFANTILSILNPQTPSATAVENSEGDSEDRKRKYGELLDQWIPPLFCQLANDARNAICTTNAGKKRKLDETDEDKATAQSNDDQDDDNIDEEPKPNASQVSNAELLASLKQKLDAYKLENERILQRRQFIYNSFVELHECYETGLDWIARANDLRNVPDNVMMERPSTAKK